MKKHIPNTITLCNLLCGCIAVVSAFSGNLGLAGLLIVLAAIFDFLDGAAAKLLNAFSPIGKDLDSLADLVSFGLAPACIAFQLVLIQLELLPSPYLAHGVFVMTLLSAVRLAKFNHDDRQTTSFIGLPTPANALFWASIPLALSELTGRVSASLMFTIFHPYCILGMAILLALLLVSPIPMLSFKVRNLSFRDNWQRYVVLWGIFLAYIIWGAPALPLGILGYIVFCIALNGLKPKANNARSYKS